MAQSYMGFVVLAAILIAFNVHSSDAANITTCWDGWATGKDIKNTMRNTTEKTCAAGTMYCLKWYLMQGTENFVGYSCGGTTKVDEKMCTIDYKDLTKTDVLEAPCKGDTKLTVCPATGTNVTVFTCNCDRKNLCNLSTNNQPTGIWNMAIGVIGAFLALKFNY